MRKTYMYYRGLIANFLAILMLQSLGFGQIQFSGFADLLFVLEPESPSIPKVQYGQFELDLSATIKPGLYFEGAIALNPETGTFEAGAGFIEIVFASDKSSHAVRGKYLDHFGLSIGQFDIPFGLDWQHIASPDRRLVSPPLLNEKSINNWNDLGLNLHADLGWTNFTCFMVNGAADGSALGGRAAFTPSGIIEVGASYFRQTDANDLGSRPQVLGSDIQTVIGPLAMRLEFIYAEDFSDGDFSAIDSINTHRGFYIQSDLDLTDIINLPLDLIARYDDWSTVNNVEEATRTTLGAAYVLKEGFEVRAEYMQDIINGDPEQQFTIQTLVSF